MSQHSGKKFVLAVMILVIIAISSYLFLYQQNIPALPKPVTLNIQQQPQLGDRNAPIQFTVFEDLKCMNCKNYNLRLFSYIKKTYIDTKQASYTAVTLSFLPHSKPAANAALCLYQQNKPYFFDYVDYIYHHQPPETTNWATLTTLLQFASQATPNADTEALSHCMITNAHYPQLEKNMAIAKTAMGDNVSTPRLYINGIIVTPLTKNQIDLVVQKIQSK